MTGSHLIGFLLLAASATAAAGLAHTSVRRHAVRDRLGWTGP